jgi:hypothetical protein
MISEFRNEREIVKELLGAETAIFRNQRSNYSRSPLNGKQEAQKRPPMIDTNSSESYIDTDEMAIPGSFLMVEKSPELMASGWDDQMEIHDYLDDSDSDFQDFDDADRLEIEANHYSTL